MATLLVALPLSGAADGMRVENGRYAGGPVTTLIVIPEQLKGWPDERWVSLTPEQKAALHTETGTAPSKVFIYDARKGESDCTCHAWNVGFLFREDGLDVPHEFIVDDEEAAKRQADFEASMM